MKPTIVFSKAYDPPRRNQYRPGDLVTFRWSGVKKTARLGVVVAWMPTVDGWGSYHVVWSDHPPLGMLAPRLSVNFNNELLLAEDWRAATPGRNLDSRRIVITHEDEAG